MDDNKPIEQTIKVRISVINRAGSETTVSREDKFTDYDPNNLSEVLAEAIDTLESPGDAVPMLLHMLDSYSSGIDSWSIYNKEAEMTFSAIVDLVNAYSAVAYSKWANCGDKPDEKAKQRFESARAKLVDLCKRVMGEDGGEIMVGGKEEVCS